jgi:hypothetical protein
MPASNYEFHKNRRNESVNEIMPCLLHVLSDFCEILYKR